MKMVCADDAGYIANILQRAARQHQQKAFTPVASVGDPWVASLDIDCQQFVITLVSGKAFDVVIRERE